MRKRIENHRKHPIIRCFEWMEYENIVWKYSFNLVDGYFSLFLVMKKNAENCFGSQTLKAQ